MTIKVEMSIPYHFNLTEEMSEYNQRSCCLADYWDYFVQRLYVVRNYIYSNTFVYIYSENIYS